MRTEIDINIDSGEGFNCEEKLFPFISSCNIACGGHAGDSDSMRAIVKLAKKHGVKIGAHPSFPDRENFGRTALQMSASELYQSVKSQIESLIVIAEKENCSLYHIKPHGALYNLAAKNKDIATIIIDVLKSFNESIKLFVPYGSVIAQLANQKKIPILYEVFADRNYNDDLSLVARSEKDALITDADKMYAHVYNMIANKKIKTITGKEVEIQADTFCLHGDDPDVSQLLTALINNLSANGILIK